MLTFIDYWYPETDKNLSGEDIKEIFKWKSRKFGETVAHELACRNPQWNTDNFEILSLADSNGNTVAHKLAQNCSNNHWTTKDPKVLSLKNKEGVTVEQILKEKDCI